MSAARLSHLVREVRESLGLSQEALAARLIPPVGRTAIAHFEQGIRLPSESVIASICEALSIPASIWAAYATSNGRLRHSFESAMSEIVGRPVVLRCSDAAATVAAESLIARLVGGAGTTRQALDCLNSILVHYGIGAISRSFFERYFSADAFHSEEKLEKAIQRYQEEAIRLFPTLSESFAALSTAVDLEPILIPLRVRSLDHYRERAEWNLVEEIPRERLPDLGYISAARVRSENAEREEVARTLRDLAGRIRENGRSAIMTLPERARRRLDTLLRKLDSSIRHDLSSPLFSPDADALEREAELLAPAATDLERMARTQATAYRNLCHYLSADHLDVYVATSMRSDADYVSVHEFTKSLFSNSEIRPLHLRYFNPTQSWIGDRVAKGLVEALMLRRSDVTVYMAQKEDTFGKDSEASVALGQGKPVVVYVPKLVTPDCDTAKLWATPRTELVREWRALERIVDDDDDDGALDVEAIASRILLDKLRSLNDMQFAEVLVTHWADFDLYGESERLPESERASYRAALDSVVRANSNSVSADLRDVFASILVAGAARFERRARTFLRAHPLALQVVARSRILNGMLVVRDVATCATLLRGLLENSLLYERNVNADNYELVERITRSTVRVIPRHELLRAAFERFYSVE